MELKLNINCQTPQTWRRHNNKNTLTHKHKSKDNLRRSRSDPSRTLYIKSPKPTTFGNPSSHTPLQVQHCEPLPQILLQTDYDQSHALPHQRRIWRRMPLPFQTPGEQRTIRMMLEKLEESSAIRVLEDDGDWSNDQFWVVLKFLRGASRCEEVLPVFDMWKNKENSRVDTSNYEKVIGLLADEDLMDEALVAFAEMKSHGLKPSSKLYDSIIQGVARRGEFDKALSFLDEMKGLSLVPAGGTFNELIQAYGKSKMYDEIGYCLRRMEDFKCLPDQVTYNLLIREFSRGGLVKRMEGIYQTVLSKRMVLQPSALLAVLETYANFGPVDRMEKIFRRVMNMNIQIKDDLVRKLAKVYIDNYMFSRLDDLGLDLSKRAGSTDLVWCLRLLSHACLLSRTGLDSVLGAMEVAGAPWTATSANIILFTYLKMKDFTHLRAVLHDMVANHIKPDMVTVGILFDSIERGFDGSHTFQTWQYVGFLMETVEMSTDPLVLTAFGKGGFLNSCEAVYSSLGPEDREGRIWSYMELINLVRRQSGQA